MKIMITDSKGDSISITVGSTGTFQDLHKGLEKGKMQLKFTAAESENEKLKSQKIPIIHSLESSMEVNSNDESNSLNLKLLEQQVASCLTQIKTEPEPETSADIRLSISNNDDDDKLKGYGNHETLNFNSLSSSSLCRLCASERNDMVYVFDKDDSHKNIIEKIAECLPIMVTKSDTLPKKVCKLCLDKLELCHKFHKSVEEAEKHFLMLGGKISCGSEKMTKYCETVSKECRTRSSSTGDEDKVIIDLPSTSQTVLRPCYSAPNSPTCTINSDEEFKLMWEESSDLNTENSPTSKRKRTENDDNASNNQGRQFRCDICGKEFRAQASVNAHQRKHRYVRSFECNICNKTFYSKDTLEMHKEIHSKSLSSNDNNYSCDKCEKTFTEKLPLSVHVNSHSSNEQIENNKKINKTSRRIGRDDRPFKCNVCQRTFDHSARLREHSSVHTGKRPYNCSLCDKSFKRANARKVHMVIHTGEKPFKCDVCGTNFRRAGDMRRHKKTQHGQNE